MYKKQCIQCDVYKTMYTIQCIQNNVCKTMHTKHVYKPCVQTMYTK